MSAIPVGRPDGSPRYEIRLQGRLDPRWAAWFDGLTLTTADDGTIWRWRTSVRRGGAGVASYDQSSSLGFPVARGRPGGDDTAAGPRTTLAKPARNPKPRRQRCTCPANDR